MENLRDAWDSLVGVLAAPLFHINDIDVTTAGLLRVVVIFIAALWVSRILRRGLLQFGQSRTTISASSLYTLGRLLHYALITVSLVIGFSTIGLDFTNLAILAGAIGVGVGFGMQNLINNFVSGIILLVEKSLKVGDFVELESGVTGEVREISIRSTLVTTNDNIDILVPNSEFVSGRMTNWTLRDVYRRVHVPFGVAYGTDKDLVKKAVLEAAAEVPHTLNEPGKEPAVWLTGFGDSSLDFELVVWLTSQAVKRPARVQADYLWEIETAFRKYEIEIPFPQRDLHVRSAFGSTALGKLRDEAAPRNGEQKDPQGEEL